ncbi:MAG: hypothetical protein J2P58_09405, partial [Acidimicrobiaceae bacterium]|nr:hypothetical protein [Acidimicrobiaceae bacterium]
MLTFDTGAASLPPIAVAVPIVGAAILLAGGRFFPRWLVDATAILIAAGVTALSAIVLRQAASGPVVTWVARWLPVHGFSVGIVLQSDPVGAGIAVLAGALTTIALLYSWRYFESEEAHYQALVLLFLAGMEGFSLTGDLFDMFVFFELMGVAAYALTGMKVEDPTAVEGSLNFGIVNSLGAYLSLTGIALLYARTGNLGLPQLGRALGHDHLSALIVAAFVLVLCGFLVKAALVPFHFWLADAHAVAPAPICVLFSGVMVPLGIYAAFRVYWVVFSPLLDPSDVRRTFLILGVVTAALGTTMCLGQRHVKRLLAYSTIAHVGLFTAAMALLSGSGTSGALLYVAGHAGAKSALFLLAGILLNRYGSVDEHELFAQGTQARWLGLAWVVAAFALAGLPPFGTALGKAVAEEAALDDGQGWLVAVFILVSALTAGAVLRVAGRVFLGLGPPPRKADDGQESTGREKPEARLTRIPLTMAAAIGILLVGTLAEGLMPSARAAADHAAAFFTHPEIYRRAAL